jgi:hypothetical protein
MTEGGAKRKELAAMAALVEFPVINDPRGNLCFTEGGRHLPFEIARAFWLYDVPSGSARGGHALRTTHQVLVALSGSFDVRLHDGRDELKVVLNRPNIGLHIEPHTWREMDNFSSGCTCMVLASAPYDEGDYVREFEDFLRSAAE